MDGKLFWLKVAVRFMVSYLRPNDDLIVVRIAYFRAIRNIKTAERLKVCNLPVRIVLLYFILNVFIALMERNSLHKNLVYHCGSHSLFLQIMNNLILIHL